MNQFNQSTQVTNFVSLGTNKIHGMMEFIKEQTRQQDLMQIEWIKEKKQMQEKIKQLEQQLQQQKKLNQNVKSNVQKTNHFRVHSELIEYQNNQEDKQQKVPLINLFLNDLKKKQHKKQISKKQLTQQQLFQITQQTQRRVWDAKEIQLPQQNIDLKVEYTLRSHLDSVRSLLFCKNQNILASASEDGLIKLWDLDNLYEPYNILRGHQEPIFAMTGNQQQGTPHEQFDVLFSAGQIGIIRAWSVPDSSEIQINNKNLISWNAHTDSIWDLQYHQKKDLMVSCSADGTNKLWDTFDSEVFQLNSGKLLSTFSYKIQNHYFYDTPTSICWIQDRIASGFQNTNNIVIYDWQVNQISQEIPYQPLSQPNKLFFHEEKIAAAHDDGKIRLFDYKSNQLIKCISAHDDSVTSIDFYKNSNIMASVSHDGYFKLWDIRNYNCLSEINAHFSKYDESVQAVVFNKKQMKIATGGADSLIKIFKEKQNQ